MPRMVQGQAGSGTHDTVAPPSLCSPGLYIARMAAARRDPRAGERVLRNEDDRLLRGASLYRDDLRRGQLFCAFVRATVAAAQIRHDRGVTPLNKAYFPHLTLPTDPAVVDALVRGTSAVMIVLEEVGGEKLEAAA